MKIKPEHFQYIKAECEKVLKLYPDKQKLYKANGLSDKRFRWDILFCAKLGDFICKEIYKYANDEHIDTALKKIIPPI